MYFYNADEPEFPTVIETDQLNNSAKHIFKRNVLAVADSLGISGGTQLSRMTENCSTKIEKTYCNTLLNSGADSPNFSIEKAGAIAEALKVPLHELLNPTFIYGQKPWATQFDLVVMAQCIQIAKDVSASLNNLDSDLSSDMASHLYHLKVSGASEADIYRKIAILANQHESKNC
jgi:hypothetical protein